jgi:hypothetical protein
MLIESARWEQPCGCVWIGAVPVVRCSRHGDMLVKAPKEQSGTISDEVCIKGQPQSDEGTDDCEPQLPSSFCCMGCACPPRVVVFISRGGHYG